MIEDHAFAKHFATIQSAPIWVEIMDQFARFCKFEPQGRLLDAGCGPGLFVHMLAATGAKVVGVDAEPAMLALARQRQPMNENVEFIQAWINNLPFPDSTFDGACATNVLFYQREPLDGLKELVRVCKPGGVIAMLNPAPILNADLVRAATKALALDDLSTEALRNWALAKEKNGTFDRQFADILFQMAEIEQIRLTELPEFPMALAIVGRKPLHPEQGAERDA